MRCSIALVLLAAPPRVCDAGPGMCPKLHNCEATKVSTAIQAVECSHNTHEKQTYAVFKQDHQYDGNHGYPYGDCAAYTCERHRTYTLCRVFSVSVNGTESGDGTGCIKDPNTSECGCEDSAAGKFHVGKTGCV
ncbi:hypothetical protein PHYSODRAFT_308801 [Phytophthora sojae]|uniref:Small secreted protein n=1 Tax=Phytophthora sojae (strain P6497) TaxID=1094619 RepID=G4YFU8_PHYSP|nr:hypothetical protein PHYSODRAFT_308801 [Phytophthora sojae]EGZ27675.1 hypothetical protein PHYSODRAFT_308801 [Phytophthora sojae]|eukprot:XP_009514950.1 hypothetical protein PHYSODRAFT_308801 [Phytophthora sojae]